MTTLLFHRSDFDQLVEPKGYPAKVAKEKFQNHPEMEYMLYSHVPVTKSGYKRIAVYYRYTDVAERLIGYYKVSARRKGPSFHFVEFKNHDDKTKSN